MSDLEKCKDSLCPSKESCLRYTLTDAVFMITANFNREDDALNCSNYINNCLINLIINNIMKQTAVELLEEQYTKQITFLHREDFEQAKELERKNINDRIDAIYEQVLQLHDNEEITGFSKRAYSQCLDIIEQFKKK